MKKSITPIFLAIAFASFISCHSTKPGVDDETVPPPPPINLTGVDDIDIEFLMADTLVGLRMLEGDIGSAEITIDSVSIEVQDYEHTRFDDKLTFSNLTTDRLVIEETVGEIQDKAPYAVSKLHFKEVILMHNGKEIGRVNDVDVNKFKVDKWLVKSDFNPRNVHEEGLYLKLSDIEDRLNKLIILVRKTTEREPDHAARTLPPELEEIRTRIIEIKDFHARNITGISTIRVHMEELDEIVLTFDEMEEEVLDPENIPNTIENTVFFDPGEYEVKQNVDLSQIDIDINKIITRAEMLYKERPDRKVKIKLSVSGYADDLDIKTGDLENSLCDSTSLVPCPPSINKQEVLNKILSDQRAKNVFRYLKVQLIRQLNAKRIEYEFNEDFVGRGQTENPKSLTRPCTGDCSERRVTVISSIVFSEKK